MTDSYVYTQTKYIDISGTRFAYRELGPRGGVPIVFLHHFTAVIDDWDPAVIDGIAEEKHVIVFDNRGLGNTSGTTPSTIQEMADDAAKFIRGLGHTYIDLLGFSLGGYVAQALTHTYPELVRKLLLTGTGPSGIANSEYGGTKVSDATTAMREKATELNKVPKHYLFFTDTDEGQVAANKFLSRISQRTIDRVKPTTEEAVAAHVKAIKTWAYDESDRLSSIKQPTFIANGDRDVMVPTARSFELHRKIQNSTLSIYPEAGHGGIFQYHELFVKQALKFINAI